MKHFSLLLAILFLQTDAYSQVSFTESNYQLPGNVNVEVSHVGIGDFNSDGKNDVVTAGTYPGDTSSQYFYIFLQNAHGKLNNTPVQVPYTHSNASNPSALVVADMNRDGYDDIVIGADSYIYVYYQSPGNTFAGYPLGHYAGQGVDAVKVADIDSDGYLDIAVSMWNESYITVFYGTATNDSFTSINYPSVSSGYDDLKVSHVGSNNQLSILKLCGQTHSLPIIETRINHNRTLNTTIYYASNISNFGWNFSGVATANWRGNGIYSIGATYGGNQPTSELKTWDNPGISNIPTDSLFVPDIPQAIYSADLNCFGKEQFVMGHGGWDEVTVAFPTGIQTFPAQIPNNMENDDLAIADVTGDGKLDIITSNTYGWVTVLENTTPEPFDSTQTVLGTFTFDSTSISNLTNPDTLLLSIDTVKHGMDTTIIQTNTFVITYYETDSLLKTQYAVTQISRCSGDTTYHNDTITIVLWRTFFQDSSAVHTVSDTLVTTGIIDLNLGIIKVFPNPFDKVINISGLSAEALVEIYDETGSVVWSGACSSNCSIASDHLAAGIYLVKITSVTGILFKKIVAL